MAKVPIKARFVAYIRVSTDQQASEGISLEAQRSRLAAYAQALDLDLVAVHEDAGAVDVVESSTADLPY